MRLGLLIYGSLNTLSGGFLYDRILVDYLEKKGDQVVIISLPWEKYLLSLRHNFSSSLWKHLQSLRLDLILEDELCHPSLFWSNQRIKGSTSLPLISIVHHLRSSEDHPRWENRVYRIIERLYLESLDGYIYNSHATRQSVENLYPHDKPSLIAQPGSDRLAAHISSEEIRARAHQPALLQMLFLGNLIPRKGLHIVLNALSRLPPGQWTLTIVGSLEMDLQYAQEMRELARSLNVEDRVQFMGPLGESRLVDVMRAHHVLVLPSSYEGYGIAYLEGMGFGLPAIATTSGGAVEIITPGENGYLVTPGDIGALAQMLSDLFNDRDRLAVMSLNARQRYLTHPTWLDTCERIRTFLLDFLI